MSVFGDVVLPRGGRIWLGSLIKLLEPLQINERLIRTSVFRLAKEEWLRTEPHGRRSDYLLTPTGLRRFEEASRHIYASNHLAWDRRWRLSGNWLPRNVNACVAPCSGKVLAFWAQTASFTRMPT